MDNLKGLSVVIPSYNENHDILTDLKKTLQFLGAEVIVVDDGSLIPFPDSIKHEHNMGYGQALMTGITNASNHVILTMDGDGQHRVQDVVNLYAAWKMLDVDMIIGARRLSGEKLIRTVGRKTLNCISSLFTGTYMQDLNSGMRIFERNLSMNYFMILCKTFSFTTSITMSYMCDNYRVEWFPIKVSERKHGASRVKLVKDGLVTLWYILKIGIALRTRRIRHFLRKFYAKS